MSYKYVRKHSSPNRTPGARGAGQIDRIVIHWWGDPKTRPGFGGVVGWLTNRRAGTSAHYVVEAGQVACIVSPKDVAWHAGNYTMNKRSIGIECNPRMSAGDLSTVVELVAELRRTYSIPESGVIGHQDVVATQCPGRYMSQLPSIRSRSTAIMRGSAVAASGVASVRAAKASTKTKRLQKRVEKKAAKRKPWPQSDLPVTKTHTTASHNAWVRLMASVGYKDRRLGTALQKWLRKLGYYRGIVDGQFGPMSVRALQSFLRAKGLYRGLVDGSRGPLTIQSEIRYLNTQRKYIKK